MDKHVISWSYWLAVASTLLALVGRLANAVMGPGQAGLTFATRGNSIGYRTFLDAALLLFLVQLGTTAYASMQARR